MKKTTGKAFMILLAAALLLGSAACGAQESADIPAGPETADAAENVTENVTEDPAEAGSDEAQGPEETLEEPEGEAAAEPSSEPETGSGVLVAYFSATGTTRGVAEMIAEIEGADLYEILPAREYTEDDLNWHDSSSRTTLEQNDSEARPEMAGDPLSLEGYATVYLGYPIWWGEEPRILDTFVEAYGFDGVTVIPFCTSSSSGIGRSGTNLEENAGSGTWLEGRRFGGDVTEEELRSWIEGLR